MKQASAEMRKGVTKPVTQAVQQTAAIENSILPFDAQNRSQNISTTNLIPNDSTDLLERSSDSSAIEEEIIPIETHRETVLTVRSETFNPTPNQKVTQSRGLATVITNSPK